MWPERLSVITETKKGRSDEKWTQAPIWKATPTETNWRTILGTESKNIKNPSFLEKWSRLRWAQNVTAMCCNPEGWPLFPYWYFGSACSHSRAFSGLGSPRLATGKTDSSSHFSSDPSWLFAWWTLDEFWQPFDLFWHFLTFFNAVSHCLDRPQPSGKRWKKIYYGPFSWEYKDVQGETNKRK